MLDYATVCHSLLFAYQKAVKKTLGSGSAIFVHPTLELLTKIIEKEGVKLIIDRNLDKTWDNLSRLFLRTNFVREFSFRKIGTEKYLLRVVGCIWAKQVHEELKPKDITCPYALIAMAAFEKATGKKVKVTESKHFAVGSETIIEPI